MPRPKKTTEVEVSAAAEPKRKRSTPAQSPAASHKHVSKKTAPPVQPDRVEEHPLEITHEAIAKLAYSYWQARGFTAGSPEQDWLRAERELLILAQNR